MLALLDVVISIVFLYLLLSLMCTSINEWIAATFKLRAKMLREGIGELLEPSNIQRIGFFRQKQLNADKIKEVTNAFYGHPLIKSLGRGNALPSYIPAKFFVTAVKESSGEGQLGSVSAGGAEDHDRELEDWFNNQMERVTGWYKRKIQIITLVVGATITVLVNADTFRAIGVLRHSPATRAAILAQAEDRVANRPVRATYPDPNQPIHAEGERSAEETVEVTEAEQEAVAPLVGWSSDFRALNAAFCERLRAERDRVCQDEGNPECVKVLEKIRSEARCRIDATRLAATDAFPGLALFSMPSLFAAHLFGWLLTIAAVSLGAPFWFDTLNRFIHLRYTGPSPEEKKKGAER